MKLRTVILAVIFPSISGIIAGSAAFVLRVDNQSLTAAFTAAGAIIALEGVLLVAFTLEATRQGVKIANDNLRIATRVGQQQLQAYVEVTNLEIKILNDKIAVAVLFQNSGQTPAKYLRFRYLFVIWSDPEVLYAYRLLETSPPSTINRIAPKSDETVYDFGISYKDIQEIAQDYSDITVAIEVEYIYVDSFDAYHARSERFKSRIAGLPANSNAASVKLEHQSSEEIYPIGKAVKHNFEYRLYLNKKFASLKAAKW